MGLLEDFIVSAKVNAKSAAETVGKFAGGVVDISKVKIDQAELNRKINGEYAKLGQMVYEASLEQSYDKESVEKEIELISELKGKLDELDGKVATLKNKVKCTQCGAINEADSSFCSKCGAKLEKKEKQPEEKTEEVQEVQVVDGDEVESLNNDEVVSDNNE